MSTVCRRSSFFCAWAVLILTVMNTQNETKSPKLTSLPIKRDDENPPRARVDVHEAPALYRTLFLNAIVSLTGLFWPFS